jgi:phosphatidylglycerol---prolipoprotein diacylglyceryl transferase
MSLGPLASIPSPARAIWHLGPVPLRAQELAIVAGIVVAIVVADLRYRSAGGPRGVITDVAAWAVPAGLIIAAVGEAAGRAHGVPWPAVHTADSILGFPGAVALGTLAAWFACRRVRLPDRIKFAPVLSAAAPAIAFGNAVAQLGDWFTQTGFGRPSTLPWAVAISPAHRPSGYENFATFTPIFLYQAVWDVTAGIGVILIARRLALSGDRVFALGAIAYAAGGFALFWLGIGHLPIILGLRAGELGDAVVLVGAVAYLVRTHRTRTRTIQSAHKPTLERDYPVM